MALTRLDGLAGVFPWWDLDRCEKGTVFTVVP